MPSGSAMIKSTTVRMPPGWAKAAEAAGEFNGDVETAVTPNATAVAERLGQFKESLDYRLQLIDAVLSLAKIDVHLV